MKDKNKEENEQNGEKQWQFDKKSTKKKNKYDQL